MPRQRPCGASLVYDAFGRRAQNTLNGVMTQYLYDGLNPVAELDGSSPPNVTATMLTGLNIDEHFQRSSSNGTFSYLTDMLGSTVALADSSGTLDTTYTYDPFGNVTVNGATNPYQFTGRENDGTGLYYYRARYYSPTLQRFIGQDPSEFTSGDPNLYQYAYGDPIDWYDSDGALPRRGGGPGKGERGRSRRNPNPEKHFKRDKKRPNCWLQRDPQTKNWDPKPEGFWPPGLPTPAPTPAATPNPTPTVPTGDEPTRFSMPPPPPWLLFLLPWAPFVFG